MFAIPLKLKGKCCASAGEFVALLGTNGVVIHRVRTGVVNGFLGFVDRRGVLFQFLLVDFAFKIVRTRYIG